MSICEHFGSLKDSLERYSDVNGTAFPFLSGTYISRVVVSQLPTV
jgi:hypothetical protein